jgi:hypothetical protein
MKKYFAKYCSDEGEINEGDKVRHNGQIVTILKKEGEGDTYKTDGFPVYGSNLQKVKLFLCSKDIEIGDKCREFNNIDKEIIADWDEVTTSIEYPGFVYFKILGEISTEAKWVKEGDEFDEDEIAHHKICHDSPYNMGCCFHCSRSKGCDSTDYNYLIKGHCGHFH